MSSSNSLQDVQFDNVSYLYQARLREHQARYNELNQQLQSPKSSTSTETDENTLLNERNHEKEVIELLSDIMTTTRKASSRANDANYWIPVSNACFAYHHLTNSR